jgi:hypothetical protein
LGTIGIILVKRLLEMGIDWKVEALPAELPGNPRGLEGSIVDSSVDGKEETVGLEYGEE